MLPQAGLKRVDEIEFFGRGEGGVTESLRAYRDGLRSRLAAATGLTGILNALVARARGGGGSVEVY